MEVSPPQLLKLTPRYLNPSGKYIVVKLSHPEQSPTILSTPSEKRIEIKPSQPWKALVDILSTLSGNSIAVNDSQKEKAHSPIYLTLSGISKFVKFLQPEKPPMPFKFSGKVMEVKLTHSAKASIPILSNLSGKSIVFRAEQYLNVPRGMYLKPSGKSMLVKPVQPEKAPLT